MKTRNEAMMKNILSAALVVVALAFPNAAFAGKRTDVVNVYEEPGYKKAAANLTPDGRELLAAELNMEMRQYPQAIPILKQLAAKRNVAELWDLLAFSHNRVGHWREAFDVSNASLKLKPTATLAYGERGIAECQLGKVVEAERDLSKYLKARRGDAGAHYYRGLALAKMHRLVEARAEMVKTRHLNPIMGTYTDYNIALIDASRGHFKKSLPPLKEIYAAYKDDNDQFSADVKKRIGQIQALEAVKDGSTAVKGAVQESDARHAASHLPR